MKTQTITGTSHFDSLTSANRYYANYGYIAMDVSDKIKAGEIHIGQPKLKPGQTLSLNTKEGRYFVTE